MVFTLVLLGWSANILVSDSFSVDAPCSLIRTSESLVLLLDLDLLLLVYFAQNLFVDFSLRSVEHLLHCNSDTILLTQVLLSKFFSLEVTLESILVL
jgi:hypothetical protein